MAWFTHDPIKQHLVKQLLTPLLVVIIAFSAWVLAARSIFELIYQVESIITPEDSNFLAQVNAEIDRSLAIAGADMTTLIKDTTSFGTEVTVQVAAITNPFAPPQATRVKPQRRPSPPQPRPEPKPKLDASLKGLARLGDDKYLAILADSQGRSQAVRVGDEFKGWLVQGITAETVFLVKGDQKLTLVWEGK